eukprot:scaffold223932_cov32-Tisochrysis_lutea.AAC.4
MEDDIVCLESCKAWGFKREQCALGCHIVDACPQMPDRLRCMRVRGWRTIRGHPDSRLVSRKPGRSISTIEWLQVRTRQEHARSHRALVCPNDPHQERVAYSWPAVCASGTGRNGAK